MKLFAKIILFLILILAVYIGCAENNRCPKIEESIQSLKGNLEFSLDTINTEKWDTVYIMEPYSNRTLDTLNIQNMPIRVRSSLRATLRGDRWCVLIFTEKQNYVNHALIERNVDFYHLQKIKYPYNQIYFLEGKDHFKKVIIIEEK
jgi:hypothetical protein